MAEDQEPAQPSITITFKGPQSAEFEMSMTNVSPFQMWGISRWLDSEAENVLQNIRMQQAMKAAQDAQNGLTVVREMPKGARGKH